MKYIVLLFMICASSFAGNYLTEIKVGHAAEAPVIDGMLTEKCWKNAQEYNHFRKFNAAELKAFPQSSVKVLYDKNNLYIALKVDNPLLKKVPENKTVVKDENQAFKYDCVEFYLSENKTQYAFFVVNIQGNKGEALFPGYDNDKFSWNCFWSAKVKRHDGFWTAEIAVPFKEIEFDVPRKGTVWWTNFSRTFAQGQSDPQKYSPNSSLNPEYGGFHALNIKLVMQGK